MWTRHARWLRLDLMTLLIGLVAGILPSCLLLLISYYYLEGLNPKTIASLQEPQIRGAKIAAQAVGTSASQVLTRLENQFLTILANPKDRSDKPILSDAKQRPAVTLGSWEYVNSLGWILDLDELWMGRPSSEYPSQYSSLGFESLLYTEDATSEALLARLVRNARDLDPPLFRTTLNNNQHRLRFANLPLPVDVVERVGLPETGTEIEPDGTLLRTFDNPGGGRFQIRIDGKRLLDETFLAVLPNLALDSELQVRLIDQTADTSVDRLSARWPVEHPFSKRWEIWVEDRGDASTLLLRILDQLGRIHYLYGGLLLLALLTCASLLFTGVFSRRVNESRKKDNFVRMVSHELRTPVASIRMIVETLALNRVRSDDERQEYLAQLEEESSRLTDLIERVLEYGRSAGEREVVTDPQALVLAAVERFRSQHRGRVEIEVQCAQEFHPVLLDREAVTGVVYNLLSNARKYSPSDLPIEVRIGEDSRNLFVEVKDHGPGIRKSEQKKIFRAFYRGSTSTGTGFGLGLAYCREVAKSHHGRLNVSSRPGEGCRFVLEIPLLRQRMAASRSEGP